MFFTYIFTILLKYNILINNMSSFEKKFQIIESFNVFIRQLGRTS